MSNIQENSSNWNDLTPKQHLDFSTYFHSLVKNEKRPFHKKYFTEKRDVHISDYNAKNTKGYILNIENDEMVLRNKSGKLSKKKTFKEFSEETNRDKWKGLASNAHDAAVDLEKRGNHPKAKQLKDYVKQLLKKAEETYD